MLTFIDAPDPDVPTRTGYGLGVRRLEIGGNEWIGHTGIAVYNRERNLTVAVLCNLSTIDQAEILQAIVNAM